MKIDLIRPVYLPGDTKESSGTVDVKKELAEKLIANGRAIKHDPKATEAEAKAEADLKAEVAELKKKLKAAEKAAADAEAKLAATQKEIAEAANAAK